MFAFPPTKTFSPVFLAMTTMPKSFNVPRNIQLRSRLRHAKYDCPGVASVEVYIHPLLSSSVFALLNLVSSIVFVLPFPVISWSWSDTDIEFLTENGDLPLIKAGTNLLFLAVSYLSPPNPRDDFELLLGSFSFSDEPSLLRPRFSCRWPAFP